MLKKLKNNLVIFIAMTLLVTTLTTVPAKAATGHTVLKGEQISLSVTNNDLESRWYLEDVTGSARIVSTGQSSIVVGSYARVEHSVKILGLASGDVRISLFTSDGRLYATDIIHVIYPLREINFDTELLQLKKGKTTQLVATPFPLDADNTDLIWSSDDNNIVSVDEQGRISANDYGTAKITVSSFDGSIRKTKEIEVVDRELIGIEVKSNPIKMDYFENYESIDLDGGILNLIYDNDTTEEIEMNSNMIESVDKKSNDIFSVNLSYKNFQTYFEVNIIPKAVESINITHLPSKIDYYENEDQDFTLEGGIIEVLYNDGTREDVLMIDSKIEHQEPFSTAGEKEVVLSYEGFEYRFTVNVKTNSIVSNWIESFPHNLTYNQFDKEIHTEGGVIAILFESGHLEYIEMNDTMVQSFDTDTPGVTLVTLYLQEYDLYLTYEIDVIEEIKEGWIFEDEKLYYYIDNVKVIDKFVKHNNTWRYLKSDGSAAQNEWATVDNSDYYFDQDFMMLSDGWKKIDSYWYYFNKNGSNKRNEWHGKGKTWYYLKDNGQAAQSEWLKIDGKYYYFNDDTVMMRRGFYLIDEKWYHFNDSGVMSASEWIPKNSGGWYYVKSSGAAAQSEWFKVGRTWYYFDDLAVMLSDGWKLIDDEWYYLNSNGAMQANKWIQSNKSWYYLKSSGAAAKQEWLKLGKSWYYFNENTRMTTGWKKLDNAWYYFESSGAMQSNKWISSGKSWYFMKSNGKAYQEEWLKQGKSWYYFDASAKMVTGWNTIKDKDYYMESSGKLKVNSWQKRNNEWYYLESDGSATRTNTLDFNNCTELRVVYPEGVSSQHPAYKPKLDRDKDGWACEIIGN